MVSGTLVCALWLIILSSCPEARQLGSLPCSLISTWKGGAGRVGFRQIFADWIDGCFRLPSQAVCTQHRGSACFIFVAPVTPRRVAHGGHAILWKMK